MMAERIEKIIPVLPGSQADRAFEEYPELVRCRDCKYYSEINNEERWCGAFDFVTSDDISNGFCAWGKRKVVE